MKALLIHNLAKLHSKKHDQKDYKRLCQIISDAYESHHAYDWNADPGTAGAFAYFGPGQFRNMYPWITRTSGEHIIIGEAASAHHAWVVGALESAVRGVYQFLFKHSAHSKAVDEALQKYNRNEITSPYGRLPAEYNRAEDVEYMSREKPTHGLPGEASHASVGEWAREQVIFGSIRLEKEDQGQDQLLCQNITEKQLAPLIEVALPS